MNKRLVFSFLGNIAYLEAGLLVFPIIVGLIYRESLASLSAYVWVQAILILLGFALRKLSPDQAIYTFVDGLAITSLAWLFLSFFGGLPLYISGQIPSLVDAVFEMASGFTTTGASILINVEALSQSALFWRSFSHLVGGMGLLVFAFAFVPQKGQGTVNIMRAEVPGPKFGKLVAKNENYAFMLYKIYLIMTAVLVLILMLTGMSLFDSLIYAFGAAGTGGFANKAESVAYFHNPAAEYVLSIAMILFGFNFNLYYFMMLGRIKDIFENEELRLFLLIIGLAIIGIMISLSGSYDSLEVLFRDTLFTVSTIISTTGYATVDFALWPLFTHVILLILMFSGGMAGSTAGGLKVSRLLIYGKTIIRELRLNLQPRRVLPITIDGEILAESYVKQTFFYFGLYGLIFIIGVLVVSVSQGPFLTAFSAVSATLNNIGPGMGVVGPTGSYAGFTVISKIVLTFLMIIGRLEIYPVLILFNYKVWAKG
ncbi:TrkH family potassium uptake protein [Eremococcus coleocola]|uniref:Cation transport protein n=1 Tax=Eremococcus coleocola ACS-139-V-Col8 TaxID=908337 RepID=E4KQZ2_9LACT|nr:TrkH family potassium uptake protein [Eremococcus coleocola]EFR30658.1 cation transport protein [Eremococcus coleocola ACS-139-V-Col8]